MLVLYIILGIILFLAAVLSLPLNIYAEYKDSFVLYLRWLFIKIYIYPPLDKKKKSKKEKKKKEESKEDKPKKEKQPEDSKEKGENFIKVFYNNQGITGILELIANICNKLGGGFKSIGKSFYIRRLWLRINVAGGNSADTAVDYGKMCSAVYPAMGYILSVVHSKNCSIKVQPDFLGSKTQGAFSLKLAVIPSRTLEGIIVMGVKILIEIIKVFISNAKNSPDQSVNNVASNEAQSNINN